MKNTIILILSFLFAVSQLIAQCDNPAKSIWENTWQSCETKDSPNPDRGDGHWIMYNFGAIHRLSKTHVWNTNEEDRLTAGFKNILVDYSLDGQTWQTLGQFELEQGTGTAVYGGFEGFDFNGAAAQYILITAIDNWGDSECFGLAEIKFNLWDDSIQNSENDDELPDIEFEMYPNPANSYVKILVEYTARTQADIIITNTLGQRVYSVPQLLTPGYNAFSLSVNNLISGFYIISIINQETGQVSSERLLISRG